MPGLGTFLFLFAFYRAGYSYIFLGIEMLVDSISQKSLNFIDAQTRSIIGQKKSKNANKNTHIQTD